MPAPGETARTADLPSVASLRGGTSSQPPRTRPRRPLHATLPAKCLKFLLRPGRFYTIGTSVGDQLSEVLVLVPEEVPDRAFFRHVHSKQLNRCFQIALRKPLDRLLEVCVGHLERLLHFLGVGDRS